MNVIACDVDPPAVVTTIVFAPADPAGVTAVMEVALTTTTPVAATPPTVTLLAPVKLVPVMVIAVPAVNGPDDGLESHDFDHHVVFSADDQSQVLGLLAPGCFSFHPSFPNKLLQTNSALTLFLEI